MCDVCNGYSGCPVCSKEPYYVECLDCNGDISITQKRETI